MIIVTIDPLVFDRRFGERCKNNRKALGLSQEDVCLELAGAGVEMCQDVYSRIELGCRSVRLFEALALSAILNIDLSTYYIPAVYAAASFQ